MRAGRRAEHLCFLLECAQVRRIGTGEELEPRRPADIGHLRKIAVAVAIVLMRQARVIVLRVADDVAILLRVDLDAGLLEELKASCGKAWPEVRRALCCQWLRHKHFLSLPVVEHRAVEEDARRRDGDVREIARRCFRRAPRRDAKVAAALDERSDCPLVRLRHAASVRDDRAVEVADDRIGFIWFHGVLSPLLIHERIS